MLVDLNAEIYNLKLQLLQASQLAGPEQIILKSELDQKLSHRIWMVLGEGAVFVFILLVGFRAVKNSIDRELKLAEQQKNFLLSVTHELRSPLASVKLQLQTLISRKLDDDKKEMLQTRALKDVNRLEKLVENLLLVNKVESGKLPLQLSEEDSTKLISRLLEDHYSTEKTEGKIVFQNTEEVLVSVDRMAIESVLINLIDNALKYGDGTTVNITLEKQTKGNSVVLKIADEGSGVPDEEKEKIFERFYRIGNEEVRKTKGTGIGLYLVKLLVESHDGTVKVSNNDPSGALFSVTIPAAKR